MQPVNGDQLAGLASPPETPFNFTAGNGGLRIVRRDGLHRTNRRSLHRMVNHTAESRLPCEPDFASASRQAGYAQALDCTDQMYKS